MTPTDAVTQIHAARDGDLDLSSFAHDRRRHLDAVAISTLAWALLACKEPPRRLVLPTTPAARHVMARVGLLFAADRRGLRFVMDGHPTTLASALRSKGGGGESPPLPGFDWKRWDELLSTDEGDIEDRLMRLRVITDLADPARQPPPPDEEQRRYRWIDNTGAAASLSRVDAKTFNADADQVVYEAIDNVHKWATAARAVASCGVSRGGGTESFNRFHIVVIDDGIGVVRSVESRRKANGLPQWDQEPMIRDLVHSENSSPCEALLRLLVVSAQGGRVLEPTDEGQGLHAVGVLTKQWFGTFRWLTADGQKGAWIGRNGSDAALESGSFPAAGLTGTLLHVTLDAKARWNPTLPPIERELASAACQLVVR